MAWYWWLLAGVMFSCILIVSAGVIGLFHRPDFDMDESEEFSGVINVRQNIKDQHDSDTVDQLRDDFDNDGA